MYFNPQEGKYPVTKSVTIPFFQPGISKELVVSLTINTPHSPQRAESLKTQPTPANKLINLAL